MTFAHRQTPPVAHAAPQPSIDENAPPAVGIRALLIGEEAGRFRHYLESHQVTVECVPRAPENILGRFDLALMRSEGAQTCNHSARLSSEGVAVLVLGGSDLHDLIHHFECGADEYLKGPVGARELLSKIKAVVRWRRRRTGTMGGPPLYHFDGWRLDTGTRCLYAPNGDEVPLTPKEFRVLYALVSRTDGMVLTKEEIQRLGDANADPRPYSTICRLRKKLSGKDRRKFIRNVRETGYIFQSKVVRFAG